MGSTQGVCQLLVVSTQLSQHVLRRYECFIVVLQALVSCDIADGAERGTADLARPLGPGSPSLKHSWPWLARCRGSSDVRPRGLGSRVPPATAMACPGCLLPGQAITEPSPEISVTGGYLTSINRRIYRQRTIIARCIQARSTS